MAAPPYVPFSHKSYSNSLPPLPKSPRDKLPVTKSVWKATKTVTKTHTATGKNKSAKRFVANDEPVALDQSPDEAAEEQSEHELFARHLCSVCPASVKLSKGKNNGGSAAVYCCPRRRTVTKTRAQTKTILKTKTVTAKPKATIQGTLFYDNNKNGVYDAGDELIRNTRVLLIIPTKKQPVRRAVGSVLSKTLTDNQGGFKIIFDAQRPNITLQIVKDVAPNDPLLEFKTNAEGGADVDVPILRPAEKVRSLLLLIITGIPLFRLTCIFSLTTALCRKRYRQQEHCHDHRNRRSWPPYRALRCRRPPVDHCYSRGRWYFHHQVGLPRFGRLPAHRQPNGLQRCRIRDDDRRNCVDLATSHC